MAQYPHLLRLAASGTLELRTGLVQTAMGSMFAEPDGSVSDQLVAYHQARAASLHRPDHPQAVSVGHPHGRVMVSSRRLRTIASSRA